MEDHDLIDRIKNGDRTVIQDVYDKSFVKIKKLIVSNSGTEDDAKDMFQEAVIILYKKCADPSFTLTCTTTTFIYTVCRNLWFKEIRKNNMMVSSNGFDEGALIDDIQEVALEHKSKDALVQNAFMILKKFGANCAEIFSMYFFYKLSFDSIASKLGYNSGQVVRQTKSKCLKKLRTEMKGNMEYFSDIVSA